MSRKRALIIGAGPAGLTAAFELLTRTDIEPIVLEQDDIVGGISRTVNYKGNRIDIGGHRFFSKSDRVMRWWLEMLPLQKTDQALLPITYQRQTSQLTIAGDGPDPEVTDDVMLIRERRSRIYYNRKFFDYPISLSSSTIGNLGLPRTGRIGLSYLKSRLAPLRPETTLEQFLINRFGRELYLTFFKSYTEKVWGVPCHEISAAWGAQRIKGLSISRTVMNALAKPFRRRAGIHQKGIETSLIEQFLYPKFGPGQMWEVCARQIEQRGGRVLTNKRVEALQTADDKVVGVDVVDRLSGQREHFDGDYVFSTMPIRTLLRVMNGAVPSTIGSIGDGLVYRDFMTVGLLLSELKIRDRQTPDRPYPSDNWIYIQEPDVHLGRLQIFNNWSPYIVADPKTVWLGLEYFCNEGDRLWSMSDEELARLGREELSRIGIIDASKVLDQTVLRVPKAYPAYFGTYDRLPALRDWLEKYQNLYLLGRNGMHRYNNQDHSMLTAMTAVDNIVANRTDKANIWDINTEQDYQEERK